MNPFYILDRVQSVYLSYVPTFQQVRNPAVRDGVQAQ
jgi:hypothetical protein